MENGTFVDRVMAFFRANPNRWLDAALFETIGGRQAWRTRIADARQRFKAANEGDVINRVARVKRADGTRYSRSQYMFVPTPTVEIPSPAAHNLNEWSLR